MLKRWLKTASRPGPTNNKNPKFNQALLLLVQKSEANARWIEERRSKVQFSPKDRKEVEGFLKETSWEETPLGAYVVTQRKLRDEAVKVKERGRREEERRRKAAKANDDEMEDF
ncbi:putative NOC2 family protein [Cyphellophora attinorum]|uniref:Putative NOC2 family protein n=1 Tax=Cyphellophora attinorum TaxID=1664694 RepID=A0A0N1P0Z8_9EURO|nr:putative NOC2 family protein [Phialophora attinorum]KPI43023.1 putative NOC2 family protein [Phialophora attinorum]